MRAHISVECLSCHELDVFGAYSAGHGSTRPRNFSSVLTLAFEASGEINRVVYEALNKTGIMKSEAAGTREVTVVQIVVRVVHVFCAPRCLPALGRWLAVGC
jgi:hypothetical protein